MNNLALDVRHGLRVLGKAPAFTAIAVLTMGIGIGANATVYGFVGSLLFRPAPGVADPSSLVEIYTSDFSSGPYGTTSYPDYLTLDADATAFTAIAAEQVGSPAVLRTRTVVERIRMSAVSGEYFQVLGLEAHSGRLIAPADAEPAAAPVAVLGFDYWRRALGADPAVLGSALTVNGRQYTVIGIAPVRFAGIDLGAPIDMWTPLLPPAHTAGERGNRRLSIIGRLRRDSSLAGAQTQVSSIAARLAREFPETNRGTLGAPDAPRPMIALEHTRLAPQFRSMVTTFGAILMSAVGLVLVIACANIASLLLSRATVRDREMAVRLALGASPRRVIRLVLIESLLLGLAGGALGLLCSLWTADLLPSFFPAEQARLLDAPLDLGGIVFILALSVGSSLLFGLAPALHAVRPVGATVLRGGEGRVAGNRTRMHLRRVLVALQVALAVVLLVAATLLTQSVVNGLSADTGFAARNVLVASVDLPAAEFTSQQGFRYYASALDRVRQVPGVHAASLVRTLPTSRPSRRFFSMEGYQPQAGEDTELHMNIAAEGYFETLQIPLVAGRTFDRRDRAGAPPVAIVNALLADRYFNGRALGRHLTDGHGDVTEIIGVVGNTVHLTIQSPRVPVVYYPLAQNYSPGMTLVVRTDGDPLRFARIARRELENINPNVPVFRTTSLADHMSEADADTRLTAALVATCGAVAVLLAMMGVYGVIAYAVSRRQREIGVRVALGARPWDILQLTMSEGLGVTLAGIIAGLGGALLLSRALQSLLYGVKPSDPLTYAAVPAAIAVVALIATCVPARRALRVDPNVVLRQD